LQIRQQHFRQSEAQLQLTRPLLYPIPLTQNEKAQNRTTGRSLIDRIESTARTMTTSTIAATTPSSDAIAVGKATSSGRQSSFRLSGHGSRQSSFRLSGHGSRQSSFRLSGHGGRQSSFRCLVGQRRRPPVDRTWSGSTYKSFGGQNDSAVGVGKTSSSDDNKASASKDGTEAGNDQGLRRPLRTPSFRFLPRRTSSSAETRSTTHNNNNNNNNNSNNNNNITNNSNRNNNHSQHSFFGGSFFGGSRHDLEFDDFDEDDFDDEPTMHCDTLHTSVSTALYPGEEDLDNAHQDLSHESCTASSLDLSCPNGLVGLELNVDEEMHRAELREEDRRSDRPSSESGSDRNNSKRLSKAKSRRFIIPPESPLSPGSPRKRRYVIPRATAEKEPTTKVGRLSRPPLEQQQEEGAVAAATSAASRRAGWHQKFKQQSGSFRNLMKNSFRRNNSSSNHRRQLPVLNTSSEEENDPSSSSSSSSDGRNAGKLMHRLGGRDRWSSMADAVAGGCRNYSISHRSLLLRNSNHKNHDLAAVPPPSPKDRWSASSYHGGGSCGGASGFNAGSIADRNTAQQLDSAMATTVTKKVAHDTPPCVRSQRPRSPPPFDLLQQLD